jgi:probable rRNA maturation factor
LSAFEIDLQVEATLLETTVELLRTVADAALREAEVTPPASLSILLTDDEHVHQLNREYRGVDEPTDVLSFPTGEGMPGTGHYLGDIAIAVPVARAQAAAAGHGLDAELALLTVHGILHLLGYDHDSTEKKAAMWVAQEEVLAGLGIEVRLPPE